MMGAIDFDHCTRAVVARTFLARVVRCNPDLTKHPACFEHPRQLNAE
jgi:hypothetical protein